MAAATRRAGVIGWPIGHSLSPLIHETWAAREGIKAAYARIEVEPGYENFARAVMRLAEQGYRGVNITLPHKENALRFAVERGGDASETALAAGAANMLTFDGAPFADNSDASGFAAALGEILDARAGRAVVLGAGGAARGIVLALTSLGVGEIVIANRTPARAEEIAGRLGARAVEWTDREGALADADILVNATSLGMKGAPPLEISIDALPDRAIVFDIVYAPLETALLKAARARGLKTIDGLSMLMHQAVPAYKTWLGARAEVDADLRARLEAALAERGAA
ncbi:MAG TPA: shikimate dehydrogenase [Parvularculaceae bacterium]|nr:shikimate dehydrogenase [Parvularculaceae bacterium]